MIVHKGDTVAESVLQKSKKDEFTKIIIGIYTNNENKRVFAAVNISFE